MIETVVLDTGPLVAFFHANEQHHAWVIDRFKALPPQFLTCESVLTETCFLLGPGSPALDQLDRFLELGVIQLPFQFSKERQAVSQLMRAYRDVPMSLADACLVRLSEIHGAGQVFTLDSDFRIYRRHGNKVIPVLMPA